MEPVDVKLSVKGPVKIEPAVTVTRDSAGHITSASSTGEDGIVRSITLPPFPERDWFTLEEGNNAPLTITLDVQESTFTITASVTGDQDVITVMPFLFPYSPRFKVANGPQLNPNPESPFNLPLDVANYIDAAIRQFGEKHGYTDLINFAIFKDVCTEAALALSPTGLNPLFDPYLPTSEQSGPIPAEGDKSWKGVVGRAVAWGLGAVATAAIVVALTPAATVTAAALAGAFVVGAVTSVASDVITALDASDDPGGSDSNSGAASSSSSGSGSNPTQKEIDKTTTDQGTARPPTDGKPGT